MSTRRRSLRKCFVVPTPPCPPDKDVTTLSDAPMITPITRADCTRDNGHSAVFLKHVCVRWKSASCRFMTTVGLLKIQNAKTEICGTAPSF